MAGYQELIKEDKFDKNDSYKIGGEVTKMCWRCEKKYLEGYMVYDISRGRRIFFCEDCYDKLE